MRIADGFLKQAGGAILAIGILSAGLFGMRPGWASIGRLLSDPNLLLQIGVLLVVSGALLIAADKIQLRRGVDHVAIRETGARGEMVMMPKDHGKNVPSIPLRNPQKRICLKPVWPQRQTSHWVGGLPHLPADTPWPLINGKPAGFQAQIALANLPETLWHGIGPRSGWLVFFGDDVETVVLHVEGPLVPRDQPEGVTHHWDLATRVDGLRQLIGSAANIPPKWFLDLADPETLGAVEDMKVRSDPAQDDPDHWNSETGAWVWEQARPLSRRSVTQKILSPQHINGTTWVTPSAILVALHITLKDRANALAYSISNHPATIACLEHEIADLTAQASGDDAAAHQAQKTLADKQHLLDRLQNDHPKKINGLEIIRLAQERVTALQTNLCALPDNTPYDPDIAAQLHDFAQRLEADLRREAAESLGFTDCFATIMENYARHAYTQDPTSNPPALYAALWQQECQDTALFLGSTIDMPLHESGWVRLIDMPSNPLTGLAIGDASRFYADLPASDLAQDDFANVRGANTHGL